MEFTGKALSRIEDVAEIGKFADKLLETKKSAIECEKAILNGVKKQAELNDFKRKSPEEQQAILDQKHAEEEEKNIDLAVRIQKSLQEDSAFDLEDDTLNNAVSLDDLDVSMN